MNENTLYSVALSVSAEPVKKGIYLFVERGASPQEAYTEAITADALNTQTFITERYSTIAIKAAEEIVKACTRERIDIIDFWHEEYPALLREIRYPPLVLYRKGRPPVDKCFSIVGTRNTDPHAQKIATIFAGALARRGFTIVSGMALGIDRAAHTGALDSGGSTIGVLANGIDVVYPLKNADLVERIASSEGSCLFSEYPPGIIAGKWTFVRRNRIISGMSRGTLVVKAGAKSGALITARYALEQDREVFACPGLALDAGYAGCHNLIRAGAILAASPEDILSDMNIPIAPTETITDDFAGEMMEGISYLFGENNRNTAAHSPAHRFSPDSLEQRILEHARPSCNIDELIRKLGEGASIVNEKITLLEIEGLLEKSGTTVRPRA